jgi:hypothetical protein
VPEPAVGVAAAAGVVPGFGEGDPDPGEDEAMVAPQPASANRMLPNMITERLCVRRGNISTSSFLWDSTVALEIMKVSQTTCEHSESHNICTSQIISRRWKSLNCSWRYQSLFRPAGTGPAA